MNRLIIVAALAFSAFSCVPYCESLLSNPETVCRRADAGAIVADTPFTIEGSSFVFGGTCSVTVDGGAISLSVAGSVCGSGNSNGAAAPAQPQLIKCGVPALPAGTYVITATTPVTFTLPETVDAGVPNCL